MIEDKIEVVRGSGNIYADVGLPDAETLKIKSMLAIAIIKRQDELLITVRATAKMAHCDTADIQRIRNADWRRFSIDRLLRFATRLGCKVELRLLGEKIAA